MNATFQVPADDITVGMNIIPEGRKLPLEVVTAEKHYINGFRNLGCYGKGFSVHAVKTGSMVTVVQ